MREIKHKVYNPKMESLESILTIEPIESDWMLLKVIPVSEYEYVAVFEKLGEDSMYSYPRNSEGTIVCGKNGCKEYTKDKEGIYKQ